MDSVPLISLSLSLLHSREKEMREREGGMQPISAHLTLALKERKSEREWHAAHLSVCFQRERERESVTQLISMSLFLSFSRSLSERERCEKEEEEIRSGTERARE